MNNSNITEFDEKLRRIRTFFDRSGYGAMVIGRQDNFAWLSCGGNNRVLITSEVGYTLLVVTRDKVYAVSQVMDCARVMDEELAGLGIEPISLHWYEDSRESRAALLVKGKRTISDIPVPGADHLPEAIYNLHYPLTELELDTCRWLGNATERILRHVADALKPGITERDAEAMLCYEYARLGITPEVMLIGSDERIAKYRHSNPTDKQIERVVLLHPAVKYRGLHANTTRMVCFGKPNAELTRRYEAASRIEAAAMSRCVAGIRYHEFLEAQKQAYAESGFADEWGNHFHGASTGYYLANTTFHFDPEMTIGLNQAWDLFVTIAGAKMEELGLNTAQGFEIPSVTGHWPVEEIAIDDHTFLLPAILQR